MTKRVRIADLKNKATQIVRDVQLRGHTYIITKHAVPVAVIKPALNEENKSEFDAQKTKTILQGIDSLAERIGKQWPEGKGAVEAIRNERR